MKACDVLKRPLLFLWAFVRPSRLPRCPRCKVEMDAHNDHEPEECEHRCETCGHVVYADLIDSNIHLYCVRPQKRGRWRHKEDWCEDWAPREVKP